MQKIPNEIERLLRQHFAANPRIGDLTNYLTDVRQELEPHLGPFLEASGKLHNLLTMGGQAALPEAHTRGLSQAKKVATNLLARLTVDALAVARLAATGFVCQSLTLVASAYETAVALVAIGTDDTEADSWISHSAQEFNFDSVRNLTNRAESKLPSGYANMYREVYGILCMFKHGNPIVQQHLGVQPCTENDGCTAFMFFPTATTKDVYLARFSICQCASLCIWALTAYLGNHAVGDPASRLLSAAKGLEQEIEKLWEEASI